MTDAEKRKQHIDRGRKLAEELGLPGDLPEDAYVRLSEGHLRQEEFSRQMNASKEAQQNYFKQADDWWNAKREELQTAKAEAQRLKEQLEARRGSNDDDLNDDTGGANGNGGVGMTPDQLKKHLEDLGVVTKNDLNGALSQFQSTGIGMMAYLQTLGARHQQEFNEILDINELIRFAQEKNVQIDRGGYEQFVSEKRAAAAEEKRKKDLEEAEERGRQKALQELRRSDGPPDVVGTPDMFPRESPLRGLSSLRKGEDGKPKPSPHGPQAANALFARLVAEKKRPPVDGGASTSE